MQTNSLPIQLNNTGPAPAQRNGAPNGANGDAGQFSAMLNNELASRQQPPAQALPPAPAPKTETPKPQATRAEDGDKPAQPDGAAPQQAGRTEDASKPAQADKADADKDERSGTEAETEADADAGAQAAAAGDPASAMLALMASLQTPAQDAAPAAAGKAAAQAFDALGGATRGKRGEAAQLASLQAAVKSAGKDGAADGGKGFPGVGAAGLRDATLATSGARILGEAGQEAPAADAAGKPAVEAGDKLGADLRAMLAGSGKAQGQGQAEMQLDAAELSLRQARDAAAAQQQQPVAAATALSQAQPAMIEAAEAAAAQSLSARVGTDAWENQVGQKVVWMVGSEEQTASLTLNPPDLGPLQVVLSVSNDQASVSFSANQEEVRHALENALPRLREMMSESGITLGNASVNAGMPDGRQAQDGGRNGGGFGQGNGQNHNGRGDAIAAGEASVRPAARTTMLGDRGMVDTFA